MDHPTSRAAFAKANAKAHVEQALESAIALSEWQQVSGDRELALNQRSVELAKEESLNGPLIGAYRALDQGVQILLEATRPALPFKRGQECKISSL